MEKNRDPGFDLSPGFDRFRPKFYLYMPHDLQLCFVIILVRTSGILIYYLFYSQLSLRIPQYTTRRVIVIVFFSEFQRKFGLSLEKILF